MKCFSGTQVVEMWSQVKIFEIVEQLVQHDNTLYPNVYAYSLIWTGSNKIYYSKEAKSYKKTGNT